MSVPRATGTPWLSYLCLAASMALVGSYVGLSRTLFSERFTSLVGMSPARYVARWRMHLAGIWLGDERLNVGEVAMRLGYESEASFSRAFKKFTGVPPGSLRRQNGAPAGAAPEPVAPMPPPYSVNLERLDTFLATT